MKIALAGNPNSGKTTLFNSLTGMNQYVGNWPGVTVEKKEGILKDDILTYIPYNDAYIDDEVLIMDLPGVYSLSPYTLEEVITRNYLVSEKPDVIINIIDGTNIERNLYLTTQLLELNIPMVIAINMMDIVRKRGDKIDTRRLSDALGKCPVFEISALKGTGIEELIKACVLQASSIHRQRLINYDSKLEDALSKISKRLYRIVPENDKRFFSIKLFERDSKIDELIHNKNIPDVDDIIKRAERTFDDDSESIVTNERYAYVSSVMKKCCTRRADTNLTISDKIDSVLTHRLLAIPIFVLFMFIVYYLSISSIGAYGTEWLSTKLFGEGFRIFGIWIPGIPILIECFIDIFRPEDWIKSLIVDGMVSGIAAVLSFVPQLIVLFACLAFMEGCGYMSRVAFIMDGFFRKIGLSGKSFIPILIGTGCSVPGIMASRTIENPIDRKITIITTSFIPCGAKLPLIALFSGALFGGAWWVSIFAYLLGIFAIIISGLILKKTFLFARGNTPFIMELPPYHLPRLTDILRSVWNKTNMFIKKAGTVILLSTIVIWFLSNIGIVNGKISMVNDISDGLLAYFGKKIAWIFSPIGFGNWESTVAVLTGLIAKENIVSTLAVLFKFGEGSVGSHYALTQNFTILSGLSFMIFNLLCAPCFAAMAAIAKEMNSKKWTAFAICYQTMFAYLVSFCVYNAGTFINSGAGLNFSMIIVVLLLIITLILFARKKNKAENI